MKLSISSALPCAFSAAMLMTACGGGGSSSNDTSSSASSTGASAAAETGSLKKIEAVFVPTTPIPSDAATRGMWSSVYNWPLIPLHAVLMPDGRVLTYGTDGNGTQTGSFIYDVWDPEGGLSGGHTTLPNNTSTDLFCSSQLVLPAGGSVFIAGGDTLSNGSTTNVGNNNTNLFAYGANTLTRANNMNRPRWYSTSITMPNGETYIQGGSSGADRPEVRGADGVFRLLGNVDTSSLNWYYPRNFVAPDGRVFGYDVAANMYMVDPSGTGTYTKLWQFNGAYAADNSSAAMFRPGRILQFGGNSNGAAVIDIRGAQPTVTATASMSSQRRWVTGTLLANGRVLATGGSSTANELTGVNNNAEIWDPDSGTWTLGSAGANARLYHSTALLLPDATVLVGGGGAPGPLNNLNVELYYPPYLFNAGKLAVRPAIASAPTVLDIGKTFRISTTGAAPARVVLVKSGSVTHSFNMEQRFLELTFSTTATAAGSDISVQAPTRAADATPGFYMLFVLDSAGVPSVAKMMRINVAATPNPAVTPVLNTPGDRANPIGSALSLQLSATDPNGDVLGYGATGLPPGLAINASTGLISGTPTTAGSYNVVVAASDGVNSASVAFTWTVTSSGHTNAPLAVDFATAPAPAQSGGTASFTASTNNGSNLRFKWSFGDGSAETAYAAAKTATHVYTAPGLYYVTVTAIDDRGVEARQTVQQQIYKPATALRPTQSSNLIVEPRSGANARIWAVNADNDSVSVFDAVTGAKQAEIAVGADPRTLALASNGMVWVTNKRGASISVIATSNLTVSRTIALPRGSQPFGIAMASNGAALVVLEASGQLLKFNTGSYAQAANLAIGANARHVSVSGDGARAWVSRFITPALPGEGTATVNTSGVGAQMLSIATGGASGTMSMERTVLLAHGERADAENQGRGIPNYLGAMAISPDGAQAFVPSKLDNIKRGGLRNGLALNFQNTVRAVSSRIDLASNAEDLATRIDHDNASLASAAQFDNSGLFLFVALETSREVAVIDAYGRRELLRFDVGRAPQGLALAPDGKTLYVSNFMDRSVGAFDLKPLLNLGKLSVPALLTLNAVATEKLSARVLKGKQFFYDARDPRLARDRYMSCASCHNDGGHDGRTWDLTSQGEGLRNTIALRGRAGMGHGALHWSGNFDEVQDFEGQIRTLAGGTGLMSDTAYNAGTRGQPLGDAKAGQSADLDALAAYVASLGSFDPAPARPSATTLSTDATAGKTLFASLNCAACHGGSAFTNSAAAGVLANVGTVKASSGKRLNGTLTGIDIPTLRDVWATAPYLHDGSAATLEAAITAHSNVSAAAADIAKIAQYLREAGSDETTAPVPAGTGLSGAYYTNATLSWYSSLTRVEAVDFDWGSGAPASGIAADNFSVRWSGSVVPTASGAWQFQTVSSDGVRLWVNGVQVINNWTVHATAATDTSASVNLVAGKAVTIKLEYYDKSGNATMRLRWQAPTGGGFVAIPKGSLLPN